MKEESAEYEKLITTMSTYITKYKENIQTLTAALNKTRAELTAVRSNRNAEVARLEAELAKAREYTEPEPTTDAAAESVERGQIENATSGLTITPPKVFEALICSVCGDNLNSLKHIVVRLAGVMGRDTQNDVEYILRGWQEDKESQT